ncbi:MAG: DUF433 domain-containing protein [Chloroflexota bacterium]
MTQGINGSQPTAFPRIVRDLHVLEGEPVVAGTLVPVRCIVIAWQLYGSETRVLQAYPRITADDLRQALGYYAVHRELIDQFIAENEDDEVEGLAGAPAGVESHFRR